MYGPHGGFGGPHGPMGYGPPPHHGPMGYGPPPPHGPMGYGPHGYHHGPHNDILCCQIY